VTHLGVEAADIQQALQVCSEVLAQSSLRAAGAARALH
jgi:hypothetical protein